MKKIISIIVICLFAKVSIAQNNTYEGNANTMTNFASSGAPTAYGLTKSYVVNAGIFSDTSQANIVNYLKNYNGAQIMTYSGGVKWWLRYGNTWNQISGSATSGWGLTGNSGTVVGTNFLGTTDSVRLDLRTNNTIRQSITGSGNVGIGTTTPSYKLDVLGKIRATDSVVTERIRSNANLYIGTYNSGSFELVADNDIAITSAPTTTLQLNAGADIQLNAGGAGATDLQVWPDSITFRTNYLRRMIINKDGNAGIGTSNPISKLHVLGTIRGTDSLILSGLATGIPSGAKRLLIGSNGSVYAADTTAGGGTTYSAGYGMTLSGSTFIADSSVLMNKAGNTFSTTTGTGHALISSTVTSGNLMSLTNTGTAAASNTKNVLAIVSSGANGTASQTVTGQTISVTNTGTTNTNVGLNVTASGATNNYAALFTGRVGIGTATPVYDMQVSSSGLVTSAITSTGNAARLRIDGSSYGNIVNASGKLYIDQAGAEDILFRYNNGSNNSMAILGSNGNVGIGTTSPDSALTVNTSARIGTNLKVGNALTIAGNGAASQPTTSLTGTWFTGGSATTTKPQLLIEPAGTTSTAWSTSGTGLGINAASGFTGNLIDAQLAGVSKFKVTSGGLLTVVGNNGATDGAANFNSSNNDMSFNAGFYYRLRATGSNKVILGSGWTGSTTYTYAEGAFTCGTTGIPTSTLQTAGSFATAYVAKTANYTATISDHTIEATSGTFTITLPTAVGITGRTYVLTNSGSGVVTISTTSSQTFVNVSATPTTLSVGQFNTVTVQSNGANWLRLTNL